MPKGRTYTARELEGIAFLLSSMLKDRKIFLNNRTDIAGAHPWLEPVIATLEHQSNYIDMVERGGGSAEFRDSVFGSVLRIALPTDCVTDGEYGLWGDTMPIEFRFTKSGDQYTFDMAWSNEDRAKNAVATIQGP